MTPVTLPNCVVQPEMVCEMQVGDKGAVDPFAITAPTKQPFIMATAALKQIGTGLVTVEKKEDGYHIDLTNVPEIRIRRDFPGGSVYRVKGVTGICCEE